MHINPSQGTIQPSFQNYPMDSLGGVADEGPLYIYVYLGNGLGEFPLKSPQNEKNSQIEIASAHIHIPRNNPAKFQNYPMDSLGGVADKGPLYICTSKKWLGGISPSKSPQNEKNSQIKIASAHIHIPRNNPAKFQNYLMDSLGGVADKGPLYICTSKKRLGGISPSKSPQNEKISKLK